MLHGYKAVGLEAIEHGVDKLPGIEVFFSEISQLEEFDISSGEGVLIVT